MKVYISSTGLTQLDCVLYHKIINCAVQICNLDIEPLEENIIILDGILFSLPEHRIEEIKQIKNKILLSFHHHKSFNLPHVNISSYKEYAEKYNFLEKNIYFFTQLAKDIEGIKLVWPGINVFNYDRWLNELFESQIIPSYNIFSNAVYSNTVLDSKKFSIFCGRFEDERLEIFCDLIAENLLDNFYYTFVNGYNEPIGNIKNAIPEKYTNIRPVIESWIDKIPYAVNMTVVPHLFEIGFYPHELRHYYVNSQVHVCLETEPKYNSFITEKTYKTMYYKRPFILISQYEALEYLKEEGYKTFHPYIDESYDKIQDYEERKNAVLEEIKRLNSLNESELAGVLEGCKDVCEHNHRQIFLNYYRQIPNSFKLAEMFNSF